MAFGWASTDFPPAFRDEHDNDYLLSKHEQSVSKEFNSHEIPIKLSLKTLYWASGGREGSVMLIGGSARARMINNDEIASTSDSCSIEKSVMSPQLQRLLTSYPCALRVLRTARHEFGFTYLTRRTDQAEAAIRQHDDKDTPIFVDVLWWDEHWPGAQGTVLVKMNIICFHHCDRCHRNRY